jgi:hypothetical protein
VPVEWEREGRIFVMRMRGSYPADALIHRLDEILALDDFPAGAGLMLDMREAESVLNRSTREMRDVTEYFAAHSEPFGHRVALLVEGLARYGLMRMAAAWADLEGVDAGVFRDEDKALAWLQSRAEAAG